MRILVWHGWLLEGSGSNVGTARTVRAWRAAGHDVALLCQERHPERYPWIDAEGTVDGDGPHALSDLPSADGPGRCVLLRPQIGPTLPVFVVDRYEGFDDVRRFTELSDRELEAYLVANADALRAAIGWHGSEVIVTGHAIPGAVIGRRGAGEGRYVAKIHGSDLEYAVRLQDRLRDLAGEGLGGARAVIGPTAEVLRRYEAILPEMRGLGHVVPPGVDADAFRPRPRTESLLDVADRLSRDADTVRGRPGGTDELVARALEERDAEAMDALADTYDQAVPEPVASERIRALASGSAPIVGYLGKLIPQKGVEMLLAAQRRLPRESDALVVGFGSYREWLAALAIAFDRHDVAALAWLRDVREMPIGHGRAGERSGTVTFTGRLDHRYAPGALDAMDVLVVPSVLEEAFGMVAAEGAAAGALPLVARHSGLAEVAAALESEAGRPGSFSFEPGSVDDLAKRLDRLLAMPAEERAEIGSTLSAFVHREWTWDRTAARILATW